GQQDSFRELFGDERQDYRQAMQNYYQQKNPPAWQDGFISAYASAHPWEDWAETWAHYLHMIDTLETANDIGFRIQNDPHAENENSGESDLSSVKGMNFNALMDDWASLTIGLNALNRSMGLPDAYPFVLSPRATAKLRFVHHIITDRQG
ncbi:MAG: putative zinc-binding metallopeptidase, partial [Pseudohongiellaceae bacterium]